MNRLARGLVLSAWAGFFAWLRLSGEVTRYLGPRTYWVVTFGGAALAIAALAHLVTGWRTSWSIRKADVAAIVVLLVPILAVVLVPRAELGSLAASRKSTGGGLASVSSVIPEPDANREIQFIDLHYANESSSYANAMGIVEGMPIELTGFVTHPPESPEDGFALTRFYVSCCAADAIPYSVMVIEESDFSDDTWLNIAGNIQLVGDQFAVVASRVERIDAPKDPYLY
jgi:putative membrane protein